MYHEEYCPGCNRGCCVCPDDPEPPDEPPDEPSDYWADVINGAMKIKIEIDGRAIEVKRSVRTVGRADPTECVSYEGTVMGVALKANLTWDVLTGTADGVAFHTNERLEAARVAARYEPYLEPPDGQSGGHTEMIWEAVRLIEYTVDTFNAVDEES